MDCSKGRWRMAILVLLSALLPAIATAQNLITDGGFEQGALTGWSSGKTTTLLTTDPRAAYGGQSGLRVTSPYNWCPYGALYTLNPAQFATGTLYEIGARVRLENGAGSSANLKMGLIKNNAVDPLWIDGEQSSYDGAAYPDRWTRLFGVYKADFLPTDSIKICVSGGVNQPFYVDDIFVTPLTTTEVGYQAPATLDTSSLVQAAGSGLTIGTTGTPFVLKGINILAYDNGYSTGQGTALLNFKFKNSDETSYRDIADLGFNSVRLMMSYLVFEDDTAPGVYKEEGWAWLERHILWAKKYGLRLVLDMHEAPGGYQSADGFKNFGSRPDLQLRLENLWTAIAQRYRNETTIVAYDLINEPYVNNWFAYAQTVIAKIRTVDPNHTVIVEESFHPSDVGLYRLADANILYDIHFYSPWNFSSVATDFGVYDKNPDWFKTQLKNFLPTSFLNAATGTFNVPLNIGEYGVVHEKYENNLGAPQWMRDISVAFDDLGINRQLFAYNEGRFGIYIGWNSYVGETTTTVAALKAVVQEINSAVAPPPPPPPPPAVTTDLTVTLSHDLTAPMAGSTVTYQAQAVNLGSAAADAQVLFPLLAGMTFVSADAGCQATSSQVLCTQAALAGGAQKSWGIKVTFTQAGTWQNSATVSATGAVTDSNPANNQAVDSISVQAPVVTGINLALTTFKASPTAPTVDSAVGINFVLINNGPTAAANVRFELPLAATVTKAPGGAAECVQSGTKIVCSFGTLAKGVSRNRYVYVRPSVAGALTFVGTALSDTPETTPANNTKQATITVR